MSESVQPDSPTKSHTPRGVAALFDRYEVLGVIGQGGMGTVYKGYHLSLKRFVAIKVLRIDRIKGPEQVSRFLREMQAIGQMDHPNVVRAADAGEKNGLFYLVMEYLEGQDLSRLVAARGPLGPADACELARQAAVGLEYIHQTLVHRDIKPSNLILTPSGQVKILDLGLARLHEADVADKERTPEGCALGTFDYMAPEQAAGGGRIDGRTDLYSLGCTLFKLLTGEAPFTGPDYDSIARKLYAHGHVPLTALAEFQSVPEALRAVLLRLTAKEPDDRFPTAGEAAQTLAPFAAGSQPARLLGGTGGAGGSAVRPLPLPLPEELSRLTGALTDTRPNDLLAPAMPAPARPFAWRRVGIGAGILVCALAAAAWFFVLGEKPQPGPDPKPPPLAADAPDGPAPLPEEVPLPPPPAPLVALDRLPELVMHNLLGPDAPPMLVGFRKGEGRSTGRWMPGRQQVEINPTDTVLMLLAADDRKEPGFTFEVLMDQRPWSGSLGLVWGYQEDAAAKAARQPGSEFAHCQGLLLERGQNPDGTLLFVDRFAGRLRYAMDGEVAMARTSHSREILPNFGGEQLFQIVVDGGRLKAARFGSFDLKDARQPQTNARFSPADYCGAFGVFSGAANVTIRRPRVMPHAGD